MRSFVHTSGLVSNDDAAVELDDALAHHVDDPLVVGSHHHSRSSLVDPVEQAHDALAGGRVEVAGRLVGQQDQRPVDERPGDRHTLLFATAELMREALLLARQTDEIEHCRHLLADDVLRSADDFQCEGHVLVHRASWQELVVLEDVADVATKVRHLAVGHLVDVSPGNPDRALLRALLAVHHPQQRALAGARGTDEEDELGLGNVETGITERDDLSRVALRDIFESDHARFSRNCRCNRRSARNSGNINALIALLAVAIADSPP